MLYVYRCPTCLRVDEEFRTVDDRNRMPVCPTCGAEMGRALDEEHGRKRNAQSGEIVSVNAGVGVKQVKEAEKLFGHMGVKFDPATGNAICPDRRTYLKYIHARGLSNKDEVCGGHVQSRDGEKWIDGYWQSRDDE